MSIGQKLYSRLSGYAGLTALVGSRIYPMQLPQGATYPAVIYERMEARRASAMGADANLVISTYQVSAWSASYATSKAVMAQIRGALQRWSDETGSNVLDVFLLDEFDDFDQDVLAYAVTCELEMIYRE